MNKIKILSAIAIVFFFSTNAFAEIYHGIDIDAVYESSDWRNREEIKQIIDDYALLSQYKKELSLCSQNTEKLSCMDKLAEDIIKRFYAGNMVDNINSYHEYVKATSSAYGVVYCLNKYKVPSGTICNQENTANTWEFVERYISDMLQSIEQILSEYSFLQNYKE